MTDNDELAMILFSRMLTRRPVWVDSSEAQRVWIQMIGLDDDGEIIAYDHEGNDRRCDAYLLSKWSPPAPTGTWSAMQHALNNHG